ncbi:hypothetical protein D3C76_407140 [compost metagenome]
MSTSVTRLVNGVPMRFQQTFNTGDRFKQPVFWVTWLSGRNTLNHQDIGFGVSPFDAYIDFCGKMGAC